MLPLTAFYRDSNSPDGLNGMCAECRRKSRRLNYAKNGIPPRTRFSTFKGDARRRGHRVLLTFEEFCALRDRACAYGGGNSPDVRIGIDRKDSAVGYTPSNCVPCCARHNEMKKHFFTHKEMLLIVSAIPSAAKCGNSNGGRKRIDPITKPAA